MHIAKRRFDLHGVTSLPSLALIQAQKKLFLLAADKPHISLP